MSLVGIVLLSRLSSLQIGLDTMNDLLSLHDKIGAKGHPLVRFNPVQRCTTSATIECFKQYHLETLLITIVVREFSKWQTLIPTVPVVPHTRTERVLKHLVHTLGLTISLRLISQTMDQVGA
jgi:hypothetical protein